MKKSSKNVGHQVRKQVRVKQQQACAVCKGRRFTVCEANGELQPNVNGTYGGLVSRKEEEKSRLLVAESGGKSAAFVLVV